MGGKSTQKKIEMLIVLIVLIVLVLVLAWMGTDLTKVGVDATTKIAGQGIDAAKSVAPELLLAGAA